MRKILLSVTTTKNSDWEKKIKEADELDLKEIALFLTGLENEKRKKLIKLLEKSEIESIPLLHLRSDMKLAELDYFWKNYQTKVFTLHSQSEFPLIYDYSKYQNLIFIENVYQPLNLAEIKNFAGICLDISHLENDRILNKEKFKHNIKVIEKYPLGGNHLSCLKKIPFRDNKGYLRYDYHNLEDLSELDYLKQYPLSYFSQIIAIELENSLQDQLRARDYIINLLKEKL